MGRWGGNLDVVQLLDITALTLIQSLYRHSTVDRTFIPGGGAWQDYGIRSVISLKLGMYVKALAQVRTHLAIRHFV